MKKELQNQQITRIIERENVITFKRKNEPKTSLKSQKDDEEDAQSAQSNHNDQPSLNKISRKNVPLPELSKQRKKLVPRNLMPDSKPSINTSYLERQVRQQDNIMLKNINNILTSQNIKLKTKNANLEKEIARLIKVVEEEVLKGKSGNIKEGKSGSIREGKGTRNDSLSLKIALKNVQRELEDVRKENVKIKTSVKFTTIAELEVQRDNILQETLRLRELLEDEKNKLFFLRANQQGLSAMEQKLSQLQEKNHYLQKQNHELKGKSGKGDEKEKNTPKISENEKNLNKMLFNARRAMKEKERELELVKNELKKSTQKIESLRVLEVGPGLESLRLKQVKSELTNKSDRNDKLKNVKQKRLMSKSAQKYRASNATSDQKNDECNSCLKLKEDNLVLTKLNEKLKADIQQLRQQKTLIGQLSKKPIIIPNKEESDKVRRFLVHRFTAHHLTLQEAAYHLTNFQGKAEDLQGEIAVGELLQIMMAEPFSILSDRYVQIFVTILGHNQYLSSPPPNNQYIISQDLMLKRRLVRDNFTKFVGNYELMNQVKQQEMFIQIAELVTQYQQHILKALTEKRNAENTIQERQFYQFFKQIDLQKEYIDFMVSQIILQSIDLDHLNIYNLFQIFYMPPQEQLIENSKPSALPGQHKKKYKMIQTVVKQEDEQYEESKSFMDTKQRTPSEHDYHQQQYHQEGKGSCKARGSSAARPQNDGYEEHFEGEGAGEEGEGAGEEGEEGEGAGEEGEAVRQASEGQYQIQNVEEEYIEDYEG